MPRGTGQVRSAPGVERAEVDRAMASRVSSRPVCGMRNSDDLLQSSHPDLHGVVSEGGRDLGFGVPGRGELL
jgi:hypothetical protein